jgi:hypothetical protein
VRSDLCPSVSLFCYERKSSPAVESVFKSLPWSKRGGNREERTFFYFAIRSHRLMIDVDLWERRLVADRWASILAEILVFLGGMSNEGCCFGHALDG